LVTFLNFPRERGGFIPLVGAPRTGESFAKNISSKIFFVRPQGPCTRKSGREGNLSEAENLEKLIKLSF